MKKVILAFLLLLGTACAECSYQHSHIFHSQHPPKASHILAEGEHTLIGKSPDGVIELDTECQFKTESGSDDVIRYWDFYDLITFTPNSSFFGGSEYYVTNLSKNETVKANIWRGPNLDNSGTDRLGKINEYKEEVILESKLGTKTRWKIHSDDFNELLNYWKMGSSVIIGKNNKGWFDSSECDYILVSYRATRHNLYVRATPIPL